MARYDVNKQLSLQLNVNNISDTEIYDASHVGLFATVGAGRSYMLTATYRFE
jgi:catecholate siderophore receptor